MVLLICGYANQCQAEYNPLLTIIDFVSAFFREKDRNKDKDKDFDIGRVKVKEEPIDGKFEDGE